MYLSPVDMSFRTLHPSTFFFNTDCVYVSSRTRSSPPPASPTMSLLFSNASRFSYSTSMSQLFSSPVKPQLRLPTHPPNVLYVNSQRRMYDTDRKFACEPGTRCAPKAFVLFNFTSSQASTAATSGPSLQVSPSR